MEDKVDVLHYLKKKGKEKCIYGLAGEEGHLYHIH